MCGRFVSASPPDVIARYFAADVVTEEVLEPSYNVAPTDPVYAVRERGDARRVDVLHWGLVPTWARDRKVGSRMINARAETLPDRSAYRAAFQRRRCIIPADGFYEWKRLEGATTSRPARQPMFIHRVDGAPLAFAGIWEAWRDPEGDPDADIVRTCAIVTGAPNEAVAAIHDRMPVILPPDTWDPWLDPGNDDLDELRSLLVPVPSATIAMHPVSSLVNDVRENGPDLVAPVAPPAPAAQGTLL
jgi:putative SOS response-associated peptidase YedK